MVVGTRRVIAGVSSSVRSLAALRAGAAEARATGAELLPVLVWEPVGGEIAYARSPCPWLLQVWEQDARDRLRGALDQALAAHLTGWWFVRPSSGVRPGRCSSGLPTGQTICWWWAAGAGVGSGTWSTVLSAAIASLMPAARCSPCPHQR